MTGFENPARVQRGQVWRRRLRGHDRRLYAGINGQWSVSHAEGRGQTATILESTIVETFDLVRDPLAEAAAILASPEAVVKHVHYGVDDPVVIGVGGYKTSGKDALAQALAERRHYVRRGMSDPLQEWALAENPWIRITDIDPEDVLDVLMPLIEVSIESRRGGAWGWLIRARVLIEAIGYDEAKKIREFREYLQRIGTEAGRSVISEDVWVDVASERIMGDLAFGRNVVITGIRYENEISMIRDLGGVSVWVDRPIITEVHEAALAKQDATATHSSEVTLTADDFDLVLVNDGTLDDLAAQAEQIADHVHTIPRKHPQGGMSGTERVREAIRQDRGGDAPSTPQGFA